MKYYNEKKIEKFLMQNYNVCVRTLQSTTYYPGH